MAKLVTNAEIALKRIKKLGKATLYDVEVVCGDKARDTVDHMHKTGRIHVVAVKTMKSKIGRDANMNVYAITKSGLDFLTKSKLKLVVPAHVPKPAIKKKAEIKLNVAPAPIQKQQLHPMQNWVIPDRDPNVNEVILEIDERKVKVTYGVHHAYEVYRPAPDQSRNYKPNPIKGIHAL